MEFIEYNIGRLLRCYFVQLRLRAAHQFGIGIKVNVCQRKIRVVPFQALQLGLKDIFTGRKPDYDLLWVVLDQLERNVALSGAGGMNNGSLAILVHHPDCRMICFLVVLKQAQCHLVHPFPHKGVSSTVIMEDTNLSTSLFEFFSYFIMVISGNQ